MHAMLFKRGKMKFKMRTTNSVEKINVGLVSNETRGALIYFGHGSRDNTLAKVMLLGLPRHSL